MEQRRENGRRNRRVLLLYQEMIPSLLLCGHCQMEWLAQNKRVEYLYRETKQVRAQELNWADIVLLGRLDGAFDLLLAKKLKNAGKTLAYILDDDLIDVPDSISSAAHYQRTDVRENILGMLRLSDAVISPSPVLLQKYAQGRRQIQIEEPAIDPAPFQAHAANEPVRIGFAGSIDRIQDIERQLGDTLTRLKAAYGDHIKFSFYGAIPSFAKAIEAETVPYCASYETYRKTLNGFNWDIGLAPMPDTPFHACKHYNKFVEYAAAGIVGVYSRVQPYKRLEVMGAPGVFCENTPQAWYEAISGLIEDAARREEMRMACCRYARERMSVELSAETLAEDLVDAFAARRCAGRCIRQETLELIKGFGRAKNAVRKYGIRLPMVLAHRLLARLYRGLLKESERI